jgi:hypothetical protein
VNSLNMHHLPEDVLRVPALPEMRRVLHPSGTPLVAKAQLPALVLLISVLRAKHGSRTLECSLG